VRFHDLRHFYASALIHKGLPVKVVQARLGHASAVETLDVYGHRGPTTRTGLARPSTSSWAARSLRTG
jgi:integrase